MIPKTIHCVWLSGEEKPALYQECMKTWAEKMPDYEVKEWNLANLPKEVLDHPFVSGAIAARKWAFATDYIRVWALYTYGGIYMDTDVYVYRSFDPFLRHRAFSCIEFDPRYFYVYLRKRKAKNILGLNIEAAILGAEKGHPWIQDIIRQYDNLNFINDHAFYKPLIMPLVVTRASLPYGFRYYPCYQVLKEDIHIYPYEVFSCCFDSSLTGKQEMADYGDNEIRYAYHACAHSWYPESKKTSITYKVKHLIIKILGKQSTDKLKKRFDKNAGNIIYDGIKLRDKV